MNQKQYIRQLNRALSLYVSWEERQDILADYREYFRDGASQGETEEQIITRLGRPQTVAQAIRAERGSLYLSKEQIFKVVKLAASILLVGVAFSCAFSYSFYLYLGGLDVSPGPYIVFLVGILNFFLRSWPWKRKLLPRNRVYPIVAACVSVVPILVSAIVPVIFIMPFLLEPSIWEVQMDPSQIGVLTEQLYWSCVLIILGLWLWLLLDPRNRTPLRQCLNLWFGGLLGFVVAGYGIIRSLVDPECLSTFGIWVEWLWPLVLGAALTGIAMLVLVLVRKWGRI